MDEKHINQVIQSISCQYQLVVVYNTLWRHGKINTDKCYFQQLEPCLKNSSALEISLQPWIDVLYMSNTKSMLLLYISCSVYI